MIRRATAIGFFLLLFLFGLAASAPPGESKTWSLEKRMESHTLANGLQVILLERPISPTASLYIRYRAGAVDEREGQTGLAHLLEHMLFKGTTTVGVRDHKKERPILRQIALIGEALDQEKRKGERADPKKLTDLAARLGRLQEAHRPLIISNEIDRLYTENGASGLNASTGQDVTTYYVNLPANKVELWARIESDRMANAVFREFFTERDVVLEERRQRVDADPDGRLYEAFMAAAFTAHPYRRPIIGWASDIEYLGMKDVERFYRLMHAPNNTVIAIVGHIDTKKTLQWIKTYFGALPRQPDPPRPTTREPRVSGEKRVLVKVDANPRMIIGFHKPALPSADDYVFDVLEAVLSSDRTSRFYRILVEEKGLAESVQAVNGLPGSRYDNLFAIFASPRQPHGNQELEAALENLLEKLKTQPVPERELQKIKNQVQAAFIRQQRSNQGLASLLSYHQSLFGSCRYLFDYVDKINAVTADDIMRIARTYLIRQNRTVAWGVKE